MGSNLEKFGNFCKKGSFSGQIWPDWGNTAWANMKGLGSIGLSILVLVLSNLSVNKNVGLYSEGN